jgi:PDDEXK-like domain of unknown function (DUF3799)
MNQIIKGMSEEMYASRNEYVRSTLLKKVITEPLSTVKCIIDGTIKFESDALKMGNGFHDLLLEGKRNYIVRPDEYQFGKKWTRAAKYCDEWEKKQTLPIVSAREVESLEGMVAAVHAHPELKDLLNGQCELAIFVDKIAKLKCRIDLLPRDPDAPVIDFKKSRDASPTEFTKQLFNLKYYLSAAMYLDILHAVDIHRKEIWYVAVEDFKPYNIWICKMVDRPVSFLEFGRKEYREAYHKLMKAIQTNHWPTYQSSEPEEHMTAWMQTALESTA